MDAMQSPLDVAVDLEELVSKAIMLCVFEDQLKRLREAKKHISNAVSCLREFDNNCE